MSPETILELRKSLGYTRAQLARAVVRAYLDAVQYEDWEDDEWGVSWQRDPLAADVDEEWGPGGSGPSRVTEVTVYRWEKGLRRPQGKHLEGLLALGHRLTHQEIQNRVRQEIAEREPIAVPPRSSAEPLSPEEIRSIRRKIGASQAQAAAIVGVQRNTWARWERGERRPHRALQGLIRLMPKPERAADKVPDVHQDEPLSWVVRRFTELRPSVE